MNFAELMLKITEILPDATMECGYDGEVIIYSGLQETENGELVPLLTEFCEVCGAAKSEKTRNCRFSK